MVDSFIETTAFSITDYKPITVPEYSDWECYIFGTGKHGITIKPLKGKVPNWFWRKMQYLVFGNEWVRLK
jgi:hypothetical protein